jgi:hypothetical protein
MSPFFVSLHLKMLLNANPLGQKQQQVNRCNYFKVQVPQETDVSILRCYHLPPKGKKTVYDI